VDEKCQVIVEAQAFGEAHEAKNLGAVVESVRESFRALDRNQKSDVCREVVLIAESGFHSEESVKGLLEGRVDAYADELVLEESSGRLVGPAGKVMKSSCPNWRDKNKGYTGKTYKGLERSVRAHRFNTRFKWCRLCSTGYESNQQISQWFVITAVSEHSLARLSHKI
jgi:hypothetical protein